MAIQFDGTGDSVSVNSTPITAVPLTIACRTKKSSLPGTGRVIAQLDGASDTDRFRIQWNTSETATAVTGDSGGTNTAVASAATNDTNWHHICGVFASATSRAIYVDGANKGTASVSKTPTGIAHIRAAITAAGGSDYDGLIEHLAIWNVALTDAEVAQLAAGASPTTIRAANLKAYWPMTNSGNPGDDTVGTYDFTLNGNAVYASGGTPLIDTVSANNQITSDETNIQVVGSGFGASGQTVHLVDGSIAVSQHVDSGADALIQFDADIGTNPGVRYGNMQVKVTTSGAVTAFKAITIDPPATKKYVTLTSLGTSGERLSTSPELAVGDQIEWSNVVGGTIDDVEVFVDGTFRKKPAVESFTFRAHNQTEGWGATNLAVIDTIPPNIDQDLAKSLIPRTINLRVNPDGTLDGAYPNGDKAPAGSTVAWGDLSALIAAVAQRTTGASFSHDIRQYLTGSSAATATLSIITVTGDNVVTEGWAYSSDNLTHPGNNTGAGFFRLGATVSGNTVYSDPIAWSWVASSSDTLAPCVPTGGEVVTAIGSLTFSCDIPSDPHDGTNAGKMASVQLRIAGATQEEVTVSPGLSPAWTLENIGTSTPSPSFSQSGQDWTISGGGVGFNAAADQVPFNYATVSGDFKISCKVTAFTSAVSQFSKFGLAVRESVAAGAKLFAVYVQESINNVQVKSRTTTGGTASNRISTASITLPIWLQIERAGDIFTAKTSTDGIVWNTIYSTSLPMAGVSLAGAVIASGVDGSAVSGTLTQLSLSNSGRVTFTPISTSIDKTVSFRSKDAANNLSAESATITGTPDVQVGGGTALFEDDIEASPIGTFDANKWGTSVNAASSSEYSQGAQTGSGLSGTKALLTTLLWTSATAGGEHTFRNELVAKGFSTGVLTGATGMLDEAWYAFTFKPQHYPASWVQALISQNHGPNFAGEMPTQVPFAMGVRHGKYKFWIIHCEDIWGDVPAASGNIMGYGTGQPNTKTTNYGLYGAGYVTTSDLGAIDPTFWDIDATHGDRFVVHIKWDYRGFTFPGVANTGLVEIWKKRADLSNGSYVKYFSKAGPIGYGYRATPSTPVQMTTYGNNWKHGVYASQQRTVDPGAANTIDGIAYAVDTDRRDTRVWHDNLKMDVGANKFNTVA